MATMLNRGGPSGVGDLGRRLGMWLLLWLGRPAVRWSVFGIFVCILLWLGWRNVWQPLSQAVPLPAGVAPMSPEIDGAALDKIQAGRQNRSQAVLHGYEEYSHYFVPLEPVLE